MTRPRPIVAAARVVACAAALAAGDALALACAGFTDVGLSDPFCPSVEWVRNRGVTVGCAPTLFCPNAPVSRLAMAAFLQRLGGALTPRTVEAQAAPGGLDLDVPYLVCTTADEAPVGYPRAAVFDGTFSAQAAGERIFHATYAWSTNGGATWTTVPEQEMRAGAAANQWVTVPVLGSAAIDAGATVRFALRVSADAATGPVATDSRCGLRVLLFNRDGATSPY